MGFEEPFNTRVALMVFEGVESGKESWSNWSKDRSPNNEAGIIDSTGSSESDVSSRDIEKN